MAKFDPKNPPAQDPTKKGDNEGVRAGDKLIVLASFTRRQARTTNKPYLRGRFEVIHGPEKGRSFFDSITLDMESAGAMFRLSMLSEQCGVTEPFDLDNDAEIRAALVRKPFKARISRTQSNGYTNNGIERYLGKEVTEADQRVMDAYLFEQAERAEQGGDGGGYSDGMDSNGMPEDDVPPPTDEDFTGTSYRGRGGGGRRNNDDLPF